MLGVGWLGGVFMSVATFGKPRVLTLCPVVVLRCDRFFCEFLIVVFAASFFGVLYFLQTLLIVSGLCSGFLVRACCCVACEISLIFLLLFCVALC